MGEGQLLARRSTAAFGQEVEVVQHARGHLEASEPIRETLLQILCQIRLHHDWKVAGLVVVAAVPDEHLVTGVALVDRRVTLEEHDLVVKGFEWWISLRASVQCSRLEQDLLAQAWV